MAPLGSGRRSKSHDASASCPEAQNPTPRPGNHAPSAGKTSSSCHSTAMKAPFSQTVKESSTTTVHKKSIGRVSKHTAKKSTLPSVEDEDDRNEDAPTNKNKADLKQKKLTKSKTPAAKRDTARAATSKVDTKSTPRAPRKPATKKKNSLIVILKLAGQHLAKLFDKADSTANRNPGSVGTSTTLFRKAKQESNKRFTASASASTHGQSSELAGSRGQKKRKHGEVDYVDQPDSVKKRRKNSPVPAGHNVDDEEAQVTNGIIPTENVEESEADMGESEESEPDEDNNYSNDLSPTYEDTIAHGTKRKHALSTFAEGECTHPGPSHKKPKLHNFNKDSLQNTNELPIQYLIPANLDEGKKNVRHQLVALQEQSVVSAKWDDYLDDNEVAGLRAGTKCIGSWEAESLDELEIEGSESRIVDRWLASQVLGCDVGEISEFGDLYLHDLVMTGDINISEQRIWNIMSNMAKTVHFLNAEPHLELKLIHQIGQFIFLLMTHDLREDIANDYLKDLEIHESRFYSTTLIQFVVKIATGIKKPSAGRFLAETNKMWGLHVRESKTGGAGKRLADQRRPEEPQPKFTIPAEISSQYSDVYESLYSVIEDRAKNEIPTPKVVVITDLGKDYDDLAAMVLLSELHRIGVIELKGFVANYLPARERARFGRGALNLLNLRDVPIAVGTDAFAGDKCSAHAAVKPHEFQDCKFMAPHKYPFLDGAVLLERVFEEAKIGGYKVSLLLISSFTDIAEFCAKHPRLVKANIDQVHLQGSYSIIDDKLTRAPDAANCNFDPKSTDEFFAFLQDKNLKSTAWSKVATFATKVGDNFFEDLAATGHPLGQHLKHTQIAQDLDFFEACKDPKTQFAPFMDVEWYLKNKSSFYDTARQPGQPLPMDADAVRPFLNKAILYDALPALGIAGDDVIQALGVLRAKQVDTSERHRVVGVAAVVRKGDGGVVETLKSEVSGVDGQRMGHVLRGLILGGLWSSVRHG